ncbi:MAG TPA: phosphoadenylyl-sulfate reductase [Xanthobacteraceae bacterium]|nr:phosphoadenylyl-sulfate reductase [Xanthobacteraceae bacterium]
MTRTAPSPLDPRELAATLAARLAPLDLFARAALIAEQVPGRVVFTTSLGLEDQAIAHAIFAQDLPIEVVTLDTGRLFSETYEVWAETEARYGRRIRGLSPDRARLEQLVARQGINGLRHSVEARRACCGVRKVEPLGRALAGAAGWITGLRAEQSADRALLDLAVVDETHAVVKVNPLFDWTRERVEAFVRQHDVPYNPLHDRGFLSIGCAPCTRAVAPGEPERAGRWWWEQNDKKECGLHGSTPQAPTTAVAQLEKV